jgi:hypothetical protein
MFVEINFKERKWLICGLYRPPSMTDDVFTLRLTSFNSSNMLLFWSSSILTSVWQRRSSLMFTSSNTGPIKHPCISCKKSVRSNQKVIQYDFCDEWTHLKCTTLSNSDYNILSTSHDRFWWNSIYCESCLYWDRHIGMNVGACVLHLSIRQICCCFDRPQYWHLYDKGDHR